MAIRSRSRRRRGRRRPQLQQVWVDPPARLHGYARVRCATSFASCWPTSPPSALRAGGERARDPAERNRRDEARPRLPERPVLKRFLLVRGTPTPARTSPTGSAEATGEGLGAGVEEAQGAARDARLRGRHSARYGSRGRRRRSSSPWAAGRRADRATCPRRDRLRAYEAARSPTTAAGRGRTSPMRQACWGGESRVEAAERIAGGLDTLMSRPEDVVVAVSHRSRSGTSSTRRTVGSPRRGSSTCRTQRRSPSPPPPSSRRRDAVCGRRRRGSPTSDRRPTARLLDNAVVNHHKRVRLSCAAPREAAHPARAHFRRGCAPTASSGTSEPTPTPGGEVTCLVSGGRLDVPLARAGRLGHRVRAVHVHHGLRGAEADADAEHCARRWAWRSYAPAASTEADLRDCGTAYREARASGDGPYRLGPGRDCALPARLERLDAGIRARREDGVVRPLLPLWREETEAHCSEHGLVWRVDSTNAGDERGLIRDRSCRCSTARAEGTRESARAGGRAAPAAPEAGGLAGRAPLSREGTRAADLGGGIRAVRTYDTLRLEGAVEWGPGVSRRTSRASARSGGRVIASRTRPESAGCARGRQGAEDERDAWPSVATEAGAVVVVAGLEEAFGWEGAVRATRRPVTSVHSDVGEVLIDEDSADEGRGVRRRGLGGLRGSRPPARRRPEAARSSSSPT